MQERDTELGAEEHFSTADLCPTLIKHIDKRIIMEGGSTSGPAPAYFNPTDYLDVPPYSPEVRQCERIFLDAPESTRDFETPHMRIGLKEHVWGLAYGLKGSVEGSITFLGSRKNIEEVKVTVS